MTVMCAACGVEQQMHKWVVTKQWTKSDDVNVEMGHIAPSEMSKTLKFLTEL